jgi:MHS family proline/betaine transporter-like MFS transporter
MKDSKKTEKKSPVSDIWHNKKYAILKIFAIAASATSITYLVRGYLNTFLIDALNYTTHRALVYTIFTLSCLTAFFPLFGWLTDKFGTNKILNFGVFFTLFGIVPSWYLLVSFTGPAQYIGLISIAIMGAAMGSPAYPYAINTFPPHIRYSGVALGWNLGNAAFGGTTPIISTLLYTHIGIVGPALYLVFTSSLFLILRWSVGLYMNKIQGKNS